MDNTWEPPERSGGIDFDNSEVHAQDVIGRDKVEINLPPFARRGCYAQLSENIKFAVFIGVLLLLIYIVFSSNSVRVSPPTPTPTFAATPTPAEPPAAVVTPANDDQQPLLPTEPVAPPGNITVTVVSPGEGTPVVPATTTAGPATFASPTPTPRGATVTLTPAVVAPGTSVPRPPTPTPRLTPTPVPATPSPQPKPTSTPRPPTPTPAPCPVADVRIGPVAKLVSVGDRFTISVLVACAVRPAGYQVEVRYNPSVVVVQGVANGTFLSSAGGAVFVAGPDVSNTTGKATIGAVVLRPGPYPSGSGTLVTLTLDAVGPGSTDLDLTASLSDVNGQAMAVSVTGGAVVVQPAPAATPNSP